MPSTIPRGWQRTLNPYTIRKGLTGGPEVTALPDGRYSAFGRLGTESIWGGRKLAGVFDSLDAACRAADGLELAKAGRKKR